MSADRRAVYLGGAAALIALVIALLLWSARDGRRGDEEAAAGGLAGGEAVEVTLYFPGPDGRLHGETRELAQGRPVERSRAIVEQLLAGPRSESLRAPLPDGIEVGSVLIGVGGIAYLDLRRPDSERPLAAGSLEERLAIYSLVNSVALNSSLVEAVTLLWNGEQPESFGGHLDTSRPLRPDSALVAGSP